MVTRFKAIQDKHGPASRGLPQHRADRHRRDGAAGRAGQVRHGHGPRRRQHPPVHGHRRHRVQAVVRLRRARRTPTRTSRSRTSSCWSVRTCASPTRSCGSASAATRTARRSSSSIPARPRRRWPPPTTCALQPKSDLALLYGVAHLLIAAGVRSINVFVDAHTTGFDALQAHVAAVHRRNGWSQATGARRRAASSELVAADRARASGCRFWWTMGVNQSHEAHPHRPGDHQPGADHRQHRPARHGRQLDHRAVQRHGLAAVQQHHQPAGWPRLHQRRAPAEGRRHPGHRRGAHPRPRTAWPTTRSWRRSLSGRDPGRCGSSPPTRRTPGSTSATPTTCCRGWSSWWCRTCTPAPRPRGLADLLLPAAGWGEKEGTFINSERRIGLTKKVARAPGQALADFSHLPAGGRGLGLRRHVRALVQPRGDVPDPQAAVARPALRHHRHRRLRHDSTGWAACSGRCPRGPPLERTSAGCSTTGASSSRTVGRA